MRGGHHLADPLIGSGPTPVAPPWHACGPASTDLLKEYRALTMTMHTHLSPLIALIVGILILIFPRFLNYLIAIYLIVTGLIGLGVLRQMGVP
jgi:hypothetical protein